MKSIIDGLAQSQVDCRGSKYPDSNGEVPIGCRCVKIAQFFAEEFIRDGKYPRPDSLGITINGTIGVLGSAFSATDADIFDQTL